MMAHSCVCDLRYIQDTNSDLRSQMLCYSQLKDLTDRVYYSECSLHWMAELPTEHQIYDYLRHGMIVQEI